MELYQLCRKDRGAETLTLLGVFLTLEAATKAADEIEPGNEFRLHLYRFDSDTKITDQSGVLVLDLFEVELDHGDNQDGYMSVTEWEQEVLNGFKIPT